MYVAPFSTNEFDKYDEPKLHMEKLLKAHLTEFNLSIRILLLLEKAGITTLGDLVQQTAKELRTINQLGKLSIDTIEKFLAENGFSLSK